MSISSRFPTSHGAARAFFNELLEKSCVVSPTVLTRRLPIDDAAQSLWAGLVEQRCGGVRARHLSAQHGSWRSPE
jgi:hypothetical protein